MKPRLALLIPCYNEEATVGRVVSSFREMLPELDVYVYDNGSTDDTRVLALAAGACVRTIAERGKGHVMRQMFADIDADVYIMVDGDDTYDATAIMGMLSKFDNEKLDLLNGARESIESGAFRFGRRFGNALFTKAVGLLFADRFKDILSGYKILSRRFVKSFPVHSTGFEIETELVIHAINLGVAIGEVPTHYRARVAGSQSKLSPFQDGLRVLWTVLKLFASERPQVCFSILFALCFLAFLAGLGFTTLIYLNGQASQLEFDIWLGLGVLLIMSILVAAAGVILDVIMKTRIEAKKLAFLAIPWIGLCEDKVFSPLVDQSFQPDRNKVLPLTGVSKRNETVPAFNKI